MKRYTKRTKPAKVSKRMLEKRLDSMESVAAKAKQDAEWAGQHLNKARVNLGLEIVRTNGLREEVARLSAKLEKVTEPAWRYADLRYDPSKESTLEQRRTLWSIHGACRIAIAVDFHHVRTTPRGDRDAYLSMLVDDFTKMARKHAIENFRVLLD